MEIPQEELEFCRKLVELAKEHGAVRLTIEYQVLRYPATNGWRDPIRVQWNRGRHGEEANVAVESVQRANFGV